MKTSSRRLLEHQDPTQEHTWLTRITISSIIVVANGILYGFYGLAGSVVLYLLGVALAHSLRGQQHSMLESDLSSDLDSFR